MASKYQIFVSSTYDDLQAERDQVIRAILEMGHIPVGMEMFSAADEQQWSIITRHIDESDYYVVIIAHRYGSIADGISYTRKEYEYALNQGVPVLGFIHDSEAPWPTERVDTDTGTKALLDDFKRLVQEKPVGYWAAAEDLYGKCSIALMKAFTARPRSGWVRASSAVGPEVIAELSRLSAENARLRQDLQVAEQQSDADREAGLRRTKETLSTNSRALSYRETKRGPWIDAGEIKLAHLFDMMAPMMQVEAALDDIANWVALNIKKSEDKPSDIVPINHIHDVLSDLVSLGLIGPSIRKHSVKDENEYWSLTDDGRDYLKWTRKALLEVVAKPAPPRRRKKVAK